MNTKSYAIMIAKEFGGINRYQLEDKLKRLLALAYAEFEKRNFELKIVVDQELLRQKTQKFSHYVTPKGEFKIPADHKMISTYESIPISTYNKAIKLIHGFDGKGWLHILEVSDELFKDFFNIAEMHPEIEFDEENNYQMFRVCNFRQRNSTEEVNKKRHYQSL